MDAEFGMCAPEDIPRALLKDVWECPKCGAQMGGGHAGTVHPPTCGWGHVPTEMEQVTPERWGRQYDDPEPREVRNDA